MKREAELAGLTIFEVVGNDAGHKVTKVTT